MYIYLSENLKNNLFAVRMFYHKSICYVLFDFISTYMQLYSYLNA